MTDKNKIDLTAALVDNEINDQELKKKFLQEIEADADLNYEFRVQALVKNIIREKVQFKETPEKVRNKVLKKIQPKEVYNARNRSLFKGFFIRPALSFATIIIIVTAVILIIMNRPGIVEPADFAIEQLGEDNMFVQANNNFRSITEGKLAPQLMSSNPAEIKNFFRSSGVKYNTIIPESARWELLGAVVSEHRGEKFAHHVYSNADGEIVYIFQVDQSYLKTNEIINLTDDLISFLELGNCYTTVKNNITTLMAQSNSIIYAVVSNAPVENITQSFCRI